MKILVVEDDFTSRTIMTSLLKEYGECDIAVDGAKAIDVFKTELESDNPYDLICLDIMLPKINGQEVLQTIRTIEKKSHATNAKVIMTTALNDSRSVLDAFNSQCEAYVVKPVSKQKLIEEMKLLKLI